MVPNASSCIAQSEDNSATLQLQVEELRESNHNLETALLSIVHDLRNPLLIIMAGSSYLLESKDKLSGQRGQSNLERICSSAQRMSEMIDALMGMCCIGGQKTFCTTVDLSRAASGIASELQQIDPNRQVTFDIQKDIYGWGDPRLLQVVMVNLIGNSWKYTVGKQPAKIEFGFATTDCQPTYFVRDNGTGFDEKYADSLFIPFQRFHDDFEGTGIGLATVQRIINRLGGRVWAHGEPGNGAIFYFTLPAF